MPVDEGNVDGYVKSDDDGDDKPLLKSDLPPELTDHTTCLTDRVTQEQCISRELVIHKVHRTFFSQLYDDAKEHYPDCDPKLA